MGINIWEPLMPRNIGQETMDRFTDPLGLRKLGSPFRYEPCAQPSTLDWVENNTGPLLPAESYENLNYMRPNSHLVRQCNPNLMGTQTPSNTLSSSLPTHASIKHVPPKFEPSFETKMIMEEMERNRKGLDREFKQAKAEMDELISQISVAPVARTIGKETVFKGYGNSHFSHVEGLGFHVTTQIPGLGQGIDISIHDSVGSGDDD